MKRVVWKPKQCAPWLTKRSSSSEEDLLITKRLRNKYGLGGFHDLCRDTDSVNTSVEVECKGTAAYAASLTSQVFEGENIKIKDEPQTPVCSISQACKQNVPVAMMGNDSRSLGARGYARNEVDSGRVQIEEAWPVDHTVYQDSDGVMPISLLKNPEHEGNHSQSIQFPLHDKPRGRKRQLAIDCSYSDSDNFAEEVSDSHRLSKLCLPMCTEENGLSAQHLFPHSLKSNTRQDCFMTPKNQPADLSRMKTLAPYVPASCDMEGRTNCLMEHGASRSFERYKPPRYRSPDCAPGSGYQNLAVISDSSLMACPSNSVMSLTHGSEMTTNKTSNFLRLSSHFWSSSPGHCVLKQNLSSHSMIQSLSSTEKNQTCAGPNTETRSLVEIPETCLLEKAVVVAETDAVRCLRESATHNLHTVLTTGNRNSCHPLLIDDTTPFINSPHTAEYLPDVAACLSRRQKKMTPHGSRHCEDTCGTSTRPTCEGKEKESSRCRIQKKLTTYFSDSKKKSRSEGIEGAARNTDTDHQVTIADTDREQKEKVQSETYDEDKQSVTGSSLPPDVEDINCLSGEGREQLAVQIDQCSLIGCMLLNEDGTTNTDSSLSSTLKVRGLLLHFDGRTCLLPVPDLCDAVITQWGRRMLNNMLKKIQTVKVAINCKKFVICLLKDFGVGLNRGVVEWQFEDPVIAGWLLSPDSPPHTLKELCNTAELHNQTDGAESDISLSVKVMERLRERLMKEGLWPLFHHVEMKLTPLLAAMELQPIVVNVQTFVTFSDILKKKLEKLEQQIYRLVGHSFCINSTQQLRQVLYEELKLDELLPCSKKVTLTASSQHKSTSESMLRLLQPTHPLPAIILQYRQLMKLKSTYIEGMLEAVNGGMLYTHWDQTSAATGRLVSSHPNMQAIPKVPTTITDYEDNFIVGSEDKSCEIYAREPYVCNPGNIFLAADFQQIELRVLAHLTKDTALKDLFHGHNQSADVFIELTALWLSKAYKDVTHAEREQTKRVVYSIMYGVGKERLAEYLKVSLSRAKDIMDSFLVSFPAIQTFTRKCIEYAKHHGHTETVMGRRRWFHKVHHHTANVRAQAERQAVNFCVQGSAADLCKRAMLQVEQALHKKTRLSARLLLHIHDELLWELPQDQLQEMCELVKEVMEDSALLCRPLLPSLSVPLAVSLSSGTSWAHLQPCV